MAAKKKKSTVVETGFKPTGISGVPWIKRGAAQQGVEAQFVPQPTIPKRARHAVDGDVVLAFVGLDLTFDATDWIVTKGGAPKLLVQELDGRPAAHALDPGDAMTATVSVISTSGAEQAHNVLMLRHQEGHVLRLYGPMIGPGKQGDVWTITGDPSIEPVGVGNSDGTLRAFRLTLELTAWNPLKGLTPVKGARVSAGSSRKKAAKKGQTQAFKKGRAVNIRDAFDG